MTNENKVFMLSFVHPKTHKPMMVTAPIKGWWEPVYGVPCEFCRRTMDGEKAMFQPPIGMICRTCWGEAFGDVT